MTKIPDNVMAAFKDPAAMKVLTTVGEDGQPHAIVAGSIQAVAPETIIVGEILMKTTAANLKNNDKAAFLVLVGKESYIVNVKAVQRVTDGPMFDGMNEVLKGMGLKAAAVWVFQPVSVYNQSANPSAGTKLA